jgi:hypothetical protein
MLHATVSLLIAASEGGGHEKSKTAFYIVGGLLAAWAVVVALLGLSSNRPANRGGERGVIAISFVLVLGAMATAVITA